MLDATRREDHANGKTQRVSAASGDRKTKAIKFEDPEINAASTTQWTVKGISKEILEASRVAARKRGMKFGAWVNQVLRDAASEDDQTLSAASKELLQKIAEIELKLDRSVGELKQQTEHIQHDVRVLHLLVPKIATG
jgi:hypothetical protein